MGRENEISGKAVLVVGTYYRPEEAGIAPYTTAMAEHLARLGACVTAVVGCPHYPAWRVAPEYARRLRSRERIAGVEVRRVRNYVPTRQTALRRSLYEATFAVQSASV
ncbi:MAG: glycosyltransferase WbuB, partial [Thermoleophilaceae bacterium]|nr:glycosyltransferase WbuB [Thermoleophilaceae bacterium]